MPSLTLSTSGSDAVERCIPRFGRNVLVTLNGVATGWTPDSDTIPGTPVFQLAGGAGSRIARQQIYSATLATLWLDAGPSIATLTVTDPQNALSGVLTVARTFEERMVARLEHLLEKSAGLTSVSLEGETLTLQDLADKRDFWLRRVNLQNGKRQRISSINLAGGGRARGGH